MGDPGVDKQFLEDLERAKRLSLECYETETNERRAKYSKVVKTTTTGDLSASASTTSTTKNGRRLSETTLSTSGKLQNLEITPRPRPYSRGLSSGGNPVGYILSPPPVDGQLTSIPPPHPFKRHRSLPYRNRHSTHPPIVSEVYAIPCDTVTSASPLNDLYTVPSASDDLIFLSSPKPAPKLYKSVWRGLDTTATPFCDTSTTATTIPTYSLPLDNLSGGLALSPTMSSSVPPTNSSIMRATLSPSAPSAVVPKNTLQNSYMPGLSNGSFQHGSTSAVIGGILHNLNKQQSPNGQPLVPFPRKLQAIGENVRVNGKSERVPSPALGSTASGSSLYSRLSAELRLMNKDDLIDLGTPGGEQDSRKILEYFDPLVIRENQLKEEEEERKKREIEERERRERSSSASTTKDLSSRSTSVEKEPLYNASIGSAATSAFSYRGNMSNYITGPPSLSLYPSLEEFEYDTVYGHQSVSGAGIGRQDISSDASSYDVYNPFEYLYAVSCSTPSASEYHASTNTQPNQYSSVQDDSSRPIGFCFDPLIVSQHGAPALPPRNSDASLSSIPPSPSGSTSSSRIQLRNRSQSYDKNKRVGKLYENIEQVKNLGSSDSEMQAFFEMLRELRFSCRHVDSSTTNKGYIRSPILKQNQCTKDISLKILVWPENLAGEPAVFTCYTSSSIDLVVEQSIMELDVTGSGRDYVLRVKDLKEYLDYDVPLGDYCYVQQCSKMSQDVYLVLVKKSTLLLDSWARTSKDDAKSVGIEINDILPINQAKTINYAEISIPLEVVDRESERIKEKMTLHLQGNVTSGTSKDTLMSGHLSPAPLMQAVKAVCTMLGEVVTGDIVGALDTLVQMCDEWNSRIKVPSPVDSKSFSQRRARIGSDVGSTHSIVEIIPQRRHSLDDTLKEFVTNAVDNVASCIRSLVEMYSKSFPVSFRMKDIPGQKIRAVSTDETQMCSRLESFHVRVQGVHRLKPEWLSTYSGFYLRGEVFHGNRWMGAGVTQLATVTKSENHWFFNTIVFDEWINFKHVAICILPRESRVVFTLHGQPREVEEVKNQKPEGNLKALGWASMQCFNFKGNLAQGEYLLPFWPMGLVQKRLGPAPNSSFSSDGNSPLLTLEFKDYGTDMPFPEIPTYLPIPRDFKTLDANTQVMLKDIIENGSYTRHPPEHYEILWEKRHYLHEFPLALPQVLLAARLWNYASLAELHAMLRYWKPLDPVDAIQLLLPAYPDGKVREEAIHRLSELPDEELINLMPQLVEAICYETFDLSPLATFLLRKSLSSLPISHNFFWMLVSQVGIGKWASETDGDPIVSRIPRAIDGHNDYDPKRRRLELMLNSLMIICGEKWRASLISQYRLVERLSDIAVKVKSTSKESARANVLWQQLQHLHESIFSERNRLCPSFPLPISASTDVISIHPDKKMSSYFNSNAMPLKITFKSGLPEAGSNCVLFKQGDDLRQDMLTLQTIRVIEKWWLREGLDLKVVTFAAVPTGFRQGMIEMVPNAVTFRQIQSEHGVTGVFRETAIAEWLAKMNPSTLDYQLAIDNFTRSCAAYCVLTYCLGICDRHNDNIMVTKRGHMFHIDYGRFLGDAQMFIKFKRDRTPFVLTSDMIYVINNGEKGSNRFHGFIELCCKAFQVVRSNRFTLSTLFRMMVSSGIPGVEMNSVEYIQEALLPAASPVEAAAQFTRFIEESSQNWFTPVNFFLHTLAQFRFSASDNTNDPNTLSFVPDIYTMAREGRIERADVTGYYKMYDPEKYYVYTIKIKRKDQAEYSYVNRTFKEFLEFNSKLCMKNPMAVGQLKPLRPNRIDAPLTRSNINKTAQIRYPHVREFIASLFEQADEIAHCDLVYTFFHPLLRDEQEQLKDGSEIALKGLAKDPSRIHGQIKISIEYQLDTLQVLILHAVDLACPNGQPPSPYVKTYLLPDTARVTKRKTAVIRRSKHPSFMELITYRLPLEMIRYKILKVSVLHYDAFQENNFLGGVCIRLSDLRLEKETLETYTLGNVTM